MKKLLIALLCVGALVSGFAVAELENPGGIGGLESLRGIGELEATRPADDFKNTSNRRLIAAMFIKHIRFL